MSRSRLMIWVLGAVGASVVGGTAGAQCQYQSTASVAAAFPCGWPNSPELFAAEALSNTGQVVGHRRTCPPDYYSSIALTWTPGSPIQELPVPADVTSAKAWDVNDSGMIVGAFSTAIKHNWGCVWTDQGFVEIPPAPGGDFCDPYAVNSSGLVVGERGYELGSRPFIWNAGSIVEIDPGPLQTGRAWDVSDSGYVVGYIGWSVTNIQAFRWKDGVLEILPPLPGAVGADARAVNSSGWTAGRSYMALPGGGYKGVVTLWVESTPVELPSIPGFPVGLPQWINDQGVVVGTVEALPGSTPAPRGVLWTNGQVYELRSLIPEVWPNYFYALGFNDQGELLGYAPPGGVPTLTIYSPIASSPGDITGDCHVDGRDLGLLLANWGAAGGVADTNADGIVDGADLAAIVDSWTW